MTTSEAGSLPPVLQKESHGENRLSHCRIVSCKLFNIVRRGVSDATKGASKAVSRRELCCVNSQPPELVS